jgi:FkbM family methyltransferase
MLRKVIVAAKTALARSVFWTRLAVVVRDQANTVVRIRLGDSPWVEESGERWLVETAGPNCETFIDVGGNKGVWTDLLLRTGGRAKRGLVFEPALPALALLRARFGGLENVTIVDKAVSDASGTIDFYEEADAGGMSSAVAGHSLQPTTRRSVATTTLDAAAQEAGFDSVDFVKIDVEGLDLAVLRGARALIERQRIGLIQFEYHHAWLRVGSTLRAAIILLENAGYEVYLLNPTGLFKPDLARYGEYFGMSNYVAVAPAWRKTVESHVRGTL